MKKLLLIVLTLFSLKGFTQDNELPKTIENFDAAFAVGMYNNSPNFSGALSFNRTHGLLKSRKLRLGYGLRFHGFGSSGDINYITAPYRLTKDPENIDTLSISKPFSMGLNASLHIEYYIINRLKIGFNIDALGIGFGPQKKNNSFISSDNNAMYNSMPIASPTLLNALLIGDRDWGQLGSEFFAAFAVIPDKLWVRAGMNFTFSEYTTTENLTNDNDRFRYKSLMGFIAVSYSPFTKK